MELKPTYGNFRITGRIYKMLTNKDGQVITTGITSNKKEYKSMRIAIETEEHNIITVELFGMVKDNVRASKKEGKGKDVKYTNIDVLWKNRNNLPKDCSLSGFEAITYTIDEEKQTKNENVSRVVYDAIDDIAKIYKEGDAVYLQGSIGYNEFNNDVRLRCSLQTLLRADESKFEREDSKPNAKFEQTLIISSTRAEKSENRLYVDGIIVTDKNGNFVEKEFYIDLTEREGLAKNIKRLKPYTMIKLAGDIINKAIVSEVEVDEDDGWGHDDVMQKSVIEGYINELKITMADKESVIEGAYSENDFINDDVLTEEEEIEDDIFDSDDSDDLGKMTTIEEAEDDDSWLDD